MDQQTLLTIFVIVAAVALVIQAGMLIGLFVVARSLQAKITAILPDVQNVVGITKRTIEAVEKHVNKIGTTSGAILDVTQQQLAKIDELLTDATTRAKVQMERAELVLDDARFTGYSQAFVLRFRTSGAVADPPSITPLQTRRCLSRPKS
jgi:hypothetical protein